MGVEVDTAIQGRRHWLILNFENLTQRVSLKVAGKMVLIDVKSKEEFDKCVKYVYF